MKKNTCLGLVLLITASLFAQSKGDIAFVGYNSDGDKDFAIVALSDIPAATTVYFTDADPNETGSGELGTGEGVLNWNTGSVIIAAGTVVVFTDIESSLTASVGTIQNSSDDLGFNLSASGDNIFATIGNPATNEVTVWLAGIEMNNGGIPTNFDKTGLEVGVNYLLIDDSNSKDGGQYKGVRSGKTVDEYRTLINNDANWDTDTTDGESFIPFNTTAFEFISLSTSINTIKGLVLSVVNKQIESNKGEIVYVYNMLGQVIPNQNLPKGIYIVAVVDGRNNAYYKIAL